MPIERWLYVLRQRLRSLVTGPRLDRELDEELHDHLDRQIQANLAAGMSAQTARRAALLAMGGLQQRKEESRDTRGLGLVEGVVGDIRYALRVLRRTPTFAATAVGVLALAIGTSTTMFSVVNGVLLRPLPFPNPDRLHVLSSADFPGAFGRSPGLSEAQYLHVAENGRVIASVGSFAGGTANLTGLGEPVRIAVARVTPSFFTTLQVTPALGRTFSIDEDQPGRNGVVVIGERLWRDQLAGRPDVIGTRLTLDGVVHEVIGVLPEAAMPSALTFPGPDAVAWLPLLIRVTPGNSLSRPVVARLAAAATRAQAQAELESLTRPATAQSSSDSRWRTEVQPLTDLLIGDADRPLAILSGVAGFVLLIACANVANLFLLRTALRRQELAVRASLGASRPRIVRQLLVESLVVSALGGVLGTSFAFWGVPAIQRFAPPGLIPRTETITIDLTVLGFTCLVSVVAGVLIALWPALQVTQARRVLVDNTRTQTVRHQRLSAFLVVSEIALALVLAAGAALMLTSFLRLRAVDSGFQPDKVTTMTVELPAARYGSVARIHEFYDQTLSRLRSIRGLSSVGVVNWLPLGTMLLRGDFEIEDGRALPSGYLADKLTVSSGYFAAMGISVIDGRDFTSEDRENSQPVVVVSRSLARDIFPRENALGRRISVWGGSTPVWQTIVGIVEDVRQQGPAGDRHPALYQPYTQVDRPFVLTQSTFVARASGDATAVPSAMRASVRSVDPDQPILSIAPMSDLIARRTALSSFQARTFSVVAVFALTLTTVGVYGVLAYAVSQRRREIAIRMALGAAAKSVSSLVLIRTLLLTVVGVALGLIGAFALAGTLRQFLFDLSPTDPTTFALVTMTVVVAALAAAAIPTWRATRVDPAEALRVE